MRFLGKIANLIALTGVALIAQCSFCQFAVAAICEPQTVEIAVSQTFPDDLTPSSQKDAKALKVAYKLTPSDSLCPMPSGSTNGAYPWTMVYNSTDVVKIEVPHAGVFEYTMSCTTEDADGWVYSKEVKRVLVYAANATDDTLSADVIVYSQDGAKDLKAAWDVSAFSYRRQPPEQEIPVETDTTEMGKTGDQGPIEAIAIGLAGCVAIGLIAYRRRRKE